MADPLILAAPISVGELFDKISILQLKAEHMAQAAQQAHVLHELAELTALQRQHGLEGAFTDLAAALLQVNRQLWAVEDELRAMERDGRFDSHFVAAARSVYRLNDQRSELKRRINLLSGSQIVEEKSYFGQEGAEAPCKCDPGSA